MDQIENGVAVGMPMEELLGDGVTEKDLSLTLAPSAEERAKLDPFYMSYFVPWNSYKNYQIAKAHGFHDLTHEWDRTHHAENFDQIDSRAYLVHSWLKYPKFGHAAATDYTARYIRYGKDDAAGAALPVLAARPVIAKRSDVKRRRARFLKELAPRGLHRRFARLDMAALKLPCRSLLMAAEQKPAVHAGHDDDVFIPFKAAQRIGSANHWCASRIRIPLS